MRTRDDLAFALRALVDQIAGRTLKVDETIHTPDHTGDHVGFLMVDERAEQG
jgi:glyoxylase-like metal-dependent hydrolase (beta-lactamase superfamily II)